MEHLISEYQKTIFPFFLLKFTCMHTSEKNKFSLKSLNFLRMDNNIKKNINIDLNLILFKNFIDIVVASHGEKRFGCF